MFWFYIYFDYKFFLIALVFTFFKFLVLVLYITIVAFKSPNQSLMNDFHDIFVIDYSILNELFFFKLFAVQSFWSNLLYNLNFLFFWWWFIKPLLHWVLMIVKCKYCCLIYLIKLEYFFQVINSVINIYRVENSINLLILIDILERYAQLLKYFIS